MTVSRCRIPAYAGMTVERAAGMAVADKTAAAIVRPSFNKFRMSGLNAAAVDNPRAFLYIPRQRRWGKSKSALAVEVKV